jgi:hypothetical protein
VRLMETDGSSDRDSDLREARRQPEWR